MAEKRMFAKTIIDSDMFLDMPMTAQLLYFHLAMRADDEGFINKPKTIMKMVGAKDDDMMVLMAKKFIISFESGVVVIKHWRIHNYIRGDRTQPTKYQKEKELLTLDENKAYKVCQADVRQLTDKCHTEIRLDKIRLDKIRLDIPESDDEKPKTKDVKHKYGEFGRVLLTNKQYEKLIKDYGKGVIDNQIKKLDEYIQSNNNKNKYSDWNLVLRKSIRDNWFKEQGEAIHKPTSFNNFDQPEYDFNAFEKKSMGTIGVNE